MAIIFFDTETTGNAENDRLIQLGVKERGVAQPRINAMYKPPLPITIEAMTIHHITEKMIADRPAFTQAAEYQDIKSLFEDEGTYSVAHNAAFDTGILAREGIVPKNVICTYKVAKALDTKDVIPKYQLQYLRYLLNIEIEATAHDAIGDVLVLEAVFEHLFKKVVETAGTEERALEEMKAISQRPMLFTTLRFGKHAGKRIADIARTDRSYLEWLLKEKKKEPSGERDWIHSLEHYLAKTE